MRNNWLRNITYNEDFKENKPLNSFKKLIDEKSEILELCYRGNSGDVCIIYYNNHKLFEIKKIKIRRYPKYKLTISFNHSRYFKNRIDTQKVLEEKFGFTIPNKTGLMYCRKNEFSEDYVNSLFDLMMPVMESYFDPEQSYNYLNPNSRRKKSEHTEKQRQQQIMTALKENVNGYFVYDLEFSQPHENKEAKEADNNSNKPDMLALKFENAKAKKIVFVEVKSKWSACVNGESNLATHIRKMVEYLANDSNMNDRKKEAIELFNNYAELELRGLKDKNKLSINDAQSIETEVMVIFTDEAIDYYNKNSKEIQSIKDIIVATFDEKKNKKLEIKQV